MHKFLEIFFISLFLLALRVSDCSPSYNHVAAARHACSKVATVWYSLLDSAPDDGRVVRPKHVEQVKTMK